MQWGLALALVTALAGQDPAADPARQLTLELRMFNGGEEVTAQTRATVHRAGDRGDPLVQIAPSDGRVQLRLAAGIYDVQAIHERDGRVLNIRWANRLVVMPYPGLPFERSFSMVGFITHNTAPAEYVGWPSWLRAGRNSPAP